MGVISIRIFQRWPPIPLILIPPNIPATASGISSDASMFRNFQRPHRYGPPKLQAWDSSFEPRSKLEGRNAVTESCYTAQYTPSNERALPCVLMKLIVHILREIQGLRQYLNNERRFHNKTHLPRFHQYLVLSGKPHSIPRNTTLNYLLIGSYDLALVQCIGTVANARIGPCHRSPKDLRYTNQHRVHDVGF
jgi:hypothetical protein